MLPHQKPIDDFMKLLGALSEQRGWYKSTKKQREYSKTRHESIPL